MLEIFYAEVERFQEKRKIFFHFFRKDSERIFQKMNKIPLLCGHSQVVHLLPYYLYVDQREKCNSLGLGCIYPFSTFRANDQDCKNSRIYNRRSGASPFWAYAIMRQSWRRGSNPWLCSEVFRRHRIRFLDSRRLPCACRPLNGY